MRAKPQQTPERRTPGRNLRRLGAAFFYRSFALCFAVAAGAATAQATAADPGGKTSAPSVVVSRVIGPDKPDPSAAPRTNKPKIEVVVAPAKPSATAAPADKQQPEKKTKRGFNLSPRRAVFLFLGIFFVIAFLFRRQILGYLLTERRPLPPVEPFETRPLGENLSAMTKAPVEGPQTAPRPRFQTQAPAAQPPAPVQTQIPIVNAPPQQAAPYYPAPYYPAPDYPPPGYFPPGCPAPGQTALPGGFVDPEEERMAFRRLKVRPKRPWE